ncbi:MAG: hypothetical protein AAF658_09260 [Myxococcota bacterium]
MTGLWPPVGAASLTPTATGVSPHKLSESPPALCAERPLEALFEASNQFREALRAEPAPFVALSNGLDVLPQTIPERVRSAGRGLVDATASWLSERGLNVSTRSLGESLVIHPDASTRLGRIAAALEKQGLMLAFSPNQLYNQSTAEFRARAIDAHDAIVLDVDTLLELESASSDRSVFADLHRVYELLNNAHSAPQLTRVTRFELNERIRCGEGAVDSEGSTREIRRVAPIGLLGVVQSLLDHAPEELAAAGAHFTPVALSDGGPHEAIRIHPNPSALGRYAEQIENAGGAVIYHPLLLWGVNATANHTLASSTVAMSAKALVRGAPTRTEEHEREHVWFTSIVHEHGRGHDYTGWVGPSESKTVNSVTTGAYRFGYSREEIYTGVHDYLDAIRPLKDVLTRIQPVAHAVQSLAPLSAAEQSALAGVIDVARLAQMDEIARVDVEQSTSMLSWVKAPALASSVGPSSYFTGNWKDGGSPKLADSNQPRPSLRIELGDGKSLQFTVAGFFRREGMRVDCLIDDTGTLPESAAERGTQGWRRDFPILDSALADRLLERLQNPAATETDPQLEADLRQALTSKLERDAARSARVSNAWDDLLTAVSAAKHAVSSSRTALSVALGDVLRAGETLASAAGDVKDFAPRPGDAG